MSFANFRGRSLELVPEPPFACNTMQNPLKRGFWNKFRTPSRKVLEPHFLWFGLPELLLKVTQVPTKTLYNISVSEETLMAIFKQQVLGFENFSVFGFQNLQATGGEQQRIKSGQNWSNESFWRGPFWRALSYTIKYSK